MLTYNRLNLPRGIPNWITLLCHHVGTYFDEHFSIGLVTFIIGNYVGTKAFIVVSRVV